MRKIAAILLCFILLAPAVSFAADSDMPEENTAEQQAGSAPLFDLEEQPAQEQPEETEEEAARAVQLPDARQVKSVLDKLSAYQLSSVPDPGVGTAHGEWTVLALARGNALTAGCRGKYLTNLYLYVMENNGILDARRYTEYSRVIIALVSIGADPRDVAGYDLLAPLADFDRVCRQGVNGAAWALIALDTRKFDVPPLPADAGKRRTSRSRLVNYIVDQELYGGGWSLTADSADADVTAMAIQALAPYYSGSGGAKGAVDRALAKLSGMQSENGDWGANCESTAQVAVALNTMGISPDDPRFVKDGNTALDGLLRYYAEEGAFRHSAAGEINPIATDQGMYALVSYYRAVTGMNSLYDMSDARVWEPDGEKERAAVIRAIGALPGTPGIDDKPAAAGLLVRLNKLEPFTGKAKYRKILNAVLAKINELEKRVDRLDRDIWDLLDPLNITVKDAEVVSRLAAEYDALREADRAHLKNARSLLDAREIVQALAGRVIPRKVFENILGKETLYTYEDAGGALPYSISVNGTDVGAPADMNAVLTAGGEGAGEAVDAYWISFTQQDAFPATVTVNASVGAADGSYTMYRYAGGEISRVGAVQVSGGRLSFSVPAGGDYFITAAGSRNAAAVTKRAAPAGGGVIEKKMFEELMGRPVNLVIEGETDAGVSYRLTFNGEEITEPMDFDPALQTESEYGMYMERLADGRCLPVHFAHHGKLPGKMLVELETDMEQGKYLLFYYDDGAMRAEYDTGAEAEGGWVRFFKERCSDYFIAKRARTVSIYELDAKGPAAAADPVEAAAGEKEEKMPEVGAVLSAGGAKRTRAARNGGYEFPYGAWAAAAVGTVIAAVYYRKRKRAK